MKNYLTYVVACGIVFPVWGQSNEPEWRVINTEPTRIVPQVGQVANPFPQVVPQTMTEVAPVEEDPERQRHLNILADVRQMLEQGDLTEPDVSQLNISGYLQGPQGAMVLADGKWFKIGQEIPVRGRPNKNVNTMMQQLDALDLEEARTLKGVITKALESKTAKRGLKITDINARELTLQSRTGKVFKVSVSVK